MSGCRLLARRITCAEVSRQVRSKTFEDYDGIADPVAYLEKFTQAIRNMGGDIYDMANVLPTCLKGNALTWFRN